MNSNQEYEVYCKQCEKNGIEPWPFEVYYQSVHN